MAHHVTDVWTPALSVLNGTQLGVIWLQLMTTRRADQRN